MGVLAGKPYRSLSRWLCSIRLSRLLVLLTVGLVIFTIPIIRLYLSFDKSKDLLFTNDDEDLNFDSLKLSVQELVRIRGSVLRELRKLDQKRLQLLEDVKGLKNSIQQLKQDQELQKARLNILKLSIREVEDARHKLGQRIASASAKLKKKSRKK